MKPVAAPCKNPCLLTRGIVRAVIHTEGVLLHEMRSRENSLRASVAANEHRGSCPLSHFLGFRVQLSPRERRLATSVQL